MRAVALVGHGRPAAGAGADEAGCGGRRRPACRRRRRGSPVETVPSIVPPSRTRSSAVAARVGHPDRALGVEADAVGEDSREQVGPHAPVAERAVGGDVERGEPVALRLADDQVRPSGVITVPLGNNRSSAARVTAPSGRRAPGTWCAAARPRGGRSRNCRRRRGPARPPPCRCTARWRPRRDRRCTSSLPPVQPQQPAVQHRDDRAARPSGVQPRPEGRCGTSTMVSARPCGIDRDHALGIEVREPQPAVAPARALREGQPVEQGREHRRPRV